MPPPVPRFHAGKPHPAQAIMPCKAAVKPDEVQSDKKVPFSLRVKMAKELGGSVLVTQDVLVDGKIKVQSDGSVAMAKGFAFSVDQSPNAGTSTLEIYMPNETENWVLVKIKSGGRLQVVKMVEMLKQQARHPKTVVSRLDFIFMEDTVRATFKVSPIVHGKMGPVTKVILEGVATHNVSLVHGEIKID